MAIVVRGAVCQQSAQSALVFLYREVLERELEGLASAVRARGSRVLPTVLTREEVKLILEEMRGWRAGSPKFRGDAGRLRQILMNLVGNAIKFTHEGSVEIRADFEEIGDGRVAMKFAVRDTGIGIPKEAQRRLFSRFTQADAKTSRLFGGTGLGLSICKQICDLMAAEIGVESAESRGSTFWIKAEFDTAAEDTGVRVGPAAERPEIVPPEPNEAADTEPRGLKILLAEDNRINQKVALAMLDSGGHAVDIAENGRQAVDAVERGDYDVVLMDIHMPEMDGVAATKAIRELADPDKASITIIALTANAMAGSRETYLAAGMNEYVSKPIDVSLLNKVLGGIGGDGTASTATPVTGAPETPKAAVPKSGQDDLAELLGSLDQIAGPATEN